MGRTLCYYEQIHRHRLSVLISCSSGPLMYNFQYVRRPVHHDASGAQLNIKDAVDQDLSDTEARPFYF